MKNKQLSSSILTAVVIIGIVFYGYNILVSDSKDKSNNPYKYDLEKYKDVEPELLQYKETGEIKIAADNLNAITVDDKDRIYVAADSAIQLYKNTGEQLTSLPVVGVPECISISDDRKIYLGLGDHVEVYNIDGKKEDEWTSLGEKAFVTSIAISGDNVFIADYGNRIVWHFDRAGKLKGQISAKSGSIKFSVPSPYFDITSGADGTFWVVNPGAHKVINFSTKRKKLSSWGKTGMEIDRFSGCCNPALLIAKRNGGFITAEKGLPRVKVYDDKGKLVSVVAGPRAFETTAPGCDGKALITDITEDSQGRILVLDRGTKSVRIFDKK